MRPAANHIRGFATGLCAALAVAALPASAGEAKLGGPADGVLPRPADDSKALFDWSWANPDASGQFTPRLSGLALTWPGGAGDDALGSGAGLGVPRAFGFFGEDVGFSLGAGVARPGDAALLGPGSADQAGVGGRVKIRSVSLGGAFIETRETGAWGEARRMSGGHDIDLSYSFSAGSVSLSHSSGPDMLRPFADQDHDTVALSGRYLVGPGLDMTAALALGGTGANDPVQSAFDGYALTAGLRLSF
jgi:hypothetical protein